jgi:hypothetical protein
MDGGHLDRGRGCYTTEERRGDRVADQESCVRVLTTTE